MLTQDKDDDKGRRKTGQKDGVILKLNDDKAPEAAAETPRLRGLFVHGIKKRMNFSAYQLSFTLFQN